jgi:hypothetical protein
MCFLREDGDERIDVLLLARRWRRENRCTASFEVVVLFEKNSTEKEGFVIPNLSISSHAWFLPCTRVLCLSDYFSSNVWFISQSLSCGPLDLRALDSSGSSSPAGAPEPKNPKASFFFNFVYALCHVPHVCHGGNLRNPDQLTRPPTVRSLGRSVVQPHKEKGRGEASHLGSHKGGAAA